LRQAFCFFRCFSNFIFSVFRLTFFPSPIFESSCAPFFFNREKRPNYFFFLRSHFFVPSFPVLPFETYILLPSLLNIWGSAPTCQVRPQAPVSCFVCVLSYQIRPFREAFRNLPPPTTLSLFFSAQSLCFLVCLSSAFSRVPFR